MTNERWMSIALEEARAAMEYSEIPVASILVGDGREVSRGQTQVCRKGSIAAHGELFAILEARGEIYKYSSLIIYTTLEPCLMCIGACAQAGVDRIVFGMKALPDGGTCMAEHLTLLEFKLPTIKGGVLEAEEVSLMREFMQRYPDSPALPYVHDLLEIYG